MKLALSIVLALAVGMATPAFADLPSKPYPARLVNDLAGVLPTYFVDSLERALVAFDDSTSNQIAVVTVSDLGGYSVAEYALHLGNKWGVGTALNNGVVILLKPRGTGDTDRYVDVTIQVGRGLEGAIPDAYAARIIRNIMGPYLREDNYTAALAGGCREIQALASGEISQPRDHSDDELTPDDYVTIAVVVILFFVVIGLISRGRGGRGGRGSDGDSGSGGGPIFIPFIFGGRGGRGSGFGSGGSFGGFGGGSFGGGGASGRF